MTIIRAIIVGNSVRHGNIVTHGHPGNATNGNREVLEVGSTIPASGDANTQNDARFDDPRYYTGDTSS